MKIYGYARISRDEDKKNYDTIIMQSSMIKRFSLEEFKEKPIKIFIDDNISGYTFNREGLNSLKELIDNNEIDILITKDFSRIGRNNGKTLLFLDYLTEHNVRLVAVAENYDSYHDSDDIIGIKTWYNERYIKDISKKVRANLREKQRVTGLVNRAPYGYIKDKQDKNKLIINIETAPIVQKIFDLYVKGYGAYSIATILQNNKIDPPAKYFYKKTGKKLTAHISEMWGGKQILKMIKNDVYMGNLCNHKTEKKKINGSSYCLDRSEYIIHENHHPAIISKEQFALCQDIIRRRNIDNIRGNKNKKQINPINLFTGFLKCADCGRNFVIRKNNKNFIYYTCGGYFQHGAKFCTTHSIHESTLKKIILDELKWIKEHIETNLSKIDKEINNKTKFIDSSKTDLQILNQKVQNKKEEIKNYSRQLAKEIISEEVATDMIKETQTQIDQLYKQIDMLTNIQKTKTEFEVKAKSTIDMIDEIIEKGDLTREILEKLIKHIYIKQLSKPHKSVQPHLIINIEWNIFISSTCKIIDQYQNSETAATLESTDLLTYLNSSNQNHTHEVTVSEDTVTSWVWLDNSKHPTMITHINLKSISV